MQREAAEGALLGLPFVLTKRDRGEDAVTLRAAAVSAAWGAAILNEVASRLPSLELPEQTASLQQLGTALKAALGRHAAQQGSAATCAGLWALAERRLAEAAAAVREAARSAEALGGCPCGLAQENSRNGPPVLCAQCARVYHAQCANFPDELFVCPECGGGAAVARFDEARGDVYVMAETAPGEKQEAASLGRLLWSAHRNHLAARQTLQQ